jgi:hypothetical protein
LIAPLHSLNTDVKAIVTQLSGNINLDTESMSEESPLYYSVTNWVLHAADVAIKPDETSKSLQLWDFRMRFLSDDTPKLQIYSTDFSDYQSKRCEDLMYDDINESYWRLHIASAYDLTSVVTWLIADHERVSSDIAISAVIDSKDECGHTPLLLASGVGREVVIRLLLARSDVDVNSKTDYNRSPLFLASSKGHEAVVRLLLARSDVDVNSKDEADWTPL